jgi:hypothetical protein
MATRHFTPSFKNLGVKNFKSLLISIPKFIELNSELILVLGFGLGSHPFFVQT